MTTLEARFHREMKKTIVYLHFEDGTTFKGNTRLESNDPRLLNGIWGEAAFTTGMSGYQETITDPSFLGQHIIFSTSHVGNYPSNNKVNQSAGCHANTIIARNFSYNEYLANLKKPLIEIPETRALIKYLTSTKSSHKSVITLNEKAPSKTQFDNCELIVNDLHLVSQQSPEVLRSGDNPILLINYGCKQAIIDKLMAMNYPMVTLPMSATAQDVLSFKPRLIFLSNGPGDPKTFKPQINVVKELFQHQIPIRGICLGHQLLGLALGAETHRLPFGQRGINHPCMDHTNGEIIITSQNHGYAIEKQSFQKILDNNALKRPLYVQYTSLFDLSIEGISTTDHFMKSVQFHPEANPGPADATIFFTEIKDFLDGKITGHIDRQNLVPMIDIQKKNNKEIPYKKILIVGSGPIKIGQASEFDYSGTQACKALKELGVDVVLLNSNPATIMTDPDMAYRTYIEPITKDTIKMIIEKESVDAVLSTMGGQTALNMCVELEEEEYLSKKGVALLGARVDTIKKTEDRKLFALELDQLGYQTGKRFSAKNENEALTTASSVCGYPLIIRRDFALGGRGSALVHNEAELKEVFNSDITFPITLEKSLLGWKEIELEVMVDKEKNGVIICSIENVDPCGVHTGDSITVAPAQTISDHCYQQMRTMTLTIAKHMGVVAGGANVQFAVNPHDENDIVVIEMNPRVSRSSALASKATGYPIAKISAMLSVGYTLREILNDITKISPVAFEPTLDYVALKIPQFPFDKFPTSSQQLGPQMRSVGEVLALGSSFNEAFMKALRSLETGLEIPTLSQLKTSPPDISKDYLEKRLNSSRELCLLTVLEALRAGFSVEEIATKTNITTWFIEQMNLIVIAENEIKENSDILDSVERFTSYKLMGFSDKYLAFLTNKGQTDILSFRTENKIFPIYKAVDTCSGEFDAKTPYFYSTYGMVNEAQSLAINGRAIAIMGSGPNRIGQGIEFDYSCVKACQHLRTKNIQAIMINSNPETVSTDYDSSDRLYLSPLYSEDLYDIFLNENPEGIIACFSGQTGIKIREHIEKSFRKNFKTFNFLGSTMETLDLTEDRKLFAEVVKKVDLAQTRAMEVRGHKNMVTAMTEIGMPVIIRPSYVIGGESMYIFHSFDDMNELPATLKEQLQTSTVTFQVENYLENALEYDVDLIRDHQGHCVFTVCEHIEYAGVHSGDSGMISPPVVLTKKLYHKMKEISIKMAELLNVIGPINFQFAVKQGEIYCIEANPRGSRTLPFLSKAYDISLPSLATDAMLGEEIKSWDRESSPYFAVKQSTFPFDRFLQDNIILGPKMRSTGETMGIDRDKEKAVLKSYLGNYPNLMKSGRVMISLADRNKEVLLPYLKALHSMGISFIGTSGTCDFIQKQGLSCQLVAKIGEEGTTIVEALKDPNMLMVFNTPMNKGDSKSDGEVIRNMAILYGVPCFTRKENIRAVMEALIGTHNSPSQKLSPLALQEMKL